MRTWEGEGKTGMSYVSPPGCAVSVPIGRRSPRGNDNIYSAASARVVVPLILDRTAGGRVVGKIWRSNAPYGSPFHESDSACIK